MASERQDLFDAVYTDLADESRCDAPGGMEYQRVKAEWQAAGRPGEGDPDTITAFIVRAANRSPVV